MLVPLPTGMGMECHGVKPLGKPCVLGGGCLKAARRGAGRGSSARRVRCKGVREAQKGVPALEGCAGRVRWKVLLEGGSSTGRGVRAWFEPWVSALEGVQAGVSRRVSNRGCTTCAPSSFKQMLVSGLNWCSGTRWWLSCRREGTVAMLQHLWCIQCRLSGTPATW